MGTAQVFGQLVGVDQDATTVTYRFGLDPWTAWDGVVTIELTDSLDSMDVVDSLDVVDVRVDGMPTPPRAALAIAAKAVRLRRASGEWPRSLTYAS